MIEKCFLCKDDCTHYVQYGKNYMCQDCFLVLKNDKSEMVVNYEKWINAMVNPPEKDGRYLVCEYFHDEDINPWIGVCSIRNGKWDSSRVKYWMELPDSPK